VRASGDRHIEVAITHVANEQGKSIDHIRHADDADDADVVAVVVVWAAIAVDVLFISVNSTVVANSPSSSSDTLVCLRANPCTARPNLNLWIFKDRQWRY
jgi:hypothetical protein